MPAALEKKKKKKGAHLRREKKGFYIADMAGPVQEV